jgi:hypothetical protein
MPNYTFVCDTCSETVVLHRAFSTGPTPEDCHRCCGTLQHDFRADALTVDFDTAACRDHNTITHAKRVFRRGSKRRADKLERRYAGHVKDRRRQLKDGNKGSIKQSHAIPADLYHGKIRETGDKQYWNDKKNLSRHSDFQVG